MKNPGFCWDGDMYPNRKRGLKANIEALQLHSAPLRILLELAPSGYCSHLCLRLTPEVLHRRHTIWPAADHNTSNTATDQFRIMMKDIAELRKSQLKTGGPLLPQELLVFSVSFCTPIDWWLAGDQK